MKKSVLALLLATYLVPSLSHAQQAPASFLGSNQWSAAQMSKGDPKRPVPRGYIVVDSVPAPGGAKLTVEVFQDRLNSAVKLSLYAAVNNGKNPIAIPLKLLTAGTPDPNLYYQKLEFHLDYKELQAFFDKTAPNAHGLKIEPGVAMVVKADFPSNHNWGGFDRGGTFFLPTPQDQNGRLMVELNHKKKDAASPSAPAARATALDVAYPIVQEMANIFNDRTTGSGVKVGGQVRSRVEGEGKFQQLTEQDYLDIKKKLIALANDPAEQARVFGPGWTLKLETRYMKKDSSGHFILDSNGLPIPDPMIDTYMDNDNYDAASKDMAIRYRWTEGNQTGSWNFKPGIGRVDPNTGIVYRIESGVDTTDDKPSTIARFADSLHPLNPFKIIYELVQGAKPSEFMKPSVKLEDVRHKFKLVNQHNLGIEISTDAVLATDLRDASGNKVKFYQIEMDIDHLSTASQNVASANTGTIDYFLGDQTKMENYVYKWSDKPETAAARDKLLAALDDKAFFDGRPVMHTVEDLKIDSPILQSRKADFDESARVITALRDHTLGGNWRPGAQKYAYAAALLGRVEGSRLSKSVRGIADMLSIQRSGMRANRCSAIFKQ